ncbi:hypothetical protein RGUI_0080 (plasmid) [Rhodovulum sp. P5]|nr:hypothetical protein RGUI_0080 [Rhodovulum sp. P5]
MPVAIAMTSPLLAWRDPVYILGGFAGVVALVLILFQPLLADGALPGLSVRRGRIVHRWLGTLLVLAVLLHVGGLWLTSPPDVIDALLFRAPTAFSVWGVIAMWALFAAALSAMLRRRLRPWRWRNAHVVLVSICVAGCVGHALLIEGTMGTVSKGVLCAATLAATAKTIFNLRQGP